MGNTDSTGSTGSNGSTGTAGRTGTAGSSGRKPVATDVLFACEDLRVAVEGKEIVKGVTLTIRRGEKVALMGPNGSGKSSLANAIMGHPAYEIVSGRVLLEGEDITALPPDEKARRGLFLAFQYPVAIPGVSVANFLRSAVNARRGKEVPIREFRLELVDAMKWLEVDSSFAGRYLNDGFSGGEKKRVAIGSSLAMNPEVLLLDEPASGLDPKTESFLTDLIISLSESGKTIVIATHDLELVDHLQPKVAVISEEHRIEKVGTVNEVLKDQDLLVKVNLVHEHRHRHGNKVHSHLHSHYFFHDHQKTHSHDGHVHSHDGHTHDKPHRHEGGRKHQDEHEKK